MSDLSAQVRKALDAAVAAIGGAPREGQIEMAEAVANALTDRHHLMVQAGTGTGKSLAYLVPALVHGRKVLVATATLALQRQLVERDLPAVVPALRHQVFLVIAMMPLKLIAEYGLQIHYLAANVLARMSVITDHNVLQPLQKLRRNWLM